MNAATKEPNKVSVLQFGNQNYFISEFLCTLSRTLTEPFDCNFFLLAQHTLQDFTISKLKKGVTKISYYYCSQYFFCYLVNLPKSTLTKHIVFREVICCSNNIFKANKWKF